MQWAFNRVSYNLSVSMDFNCRNSPPVFTTRILSVTPRTVMFMKNSTRATMAAHNRLTALT